jgi:hypothetical protein
MVWLEEPSRLSYDPKRLEAKRQLLGGLRMLLAPQFEEGCRVDALHHLEPVHPSMAGPAERDQPRETRAAGVAMMNNEGRRTVAGCSTEAAEPAIAGNHRSAETGIVAPVMLLAGIAGGAEAALCYLKRPAPAPQGRLAAAEGVLPRRPLPYPG